MGTKYEDAKAVTARLAMEYEEINKISLLPEFELAKYIYKLEKRIEELEKKLFISMFG